VCMMRPRISVNRLVQVNRIPEVLPINNCSCSILLDSGSAPRFQPPSVTFVSASWGNS
jgi:hypothetical protein